ncbi:hypothetical protein RF11_11099 [Thelohanellus kitauei]|uniref:Uncharacterized protein n=1 Tax=Thelohanellus kitauei TaxID=669202 RepID=A0A0C2JJ86_THEKT|nr:hypothetical protein RF11_11099 [Thelohanellus kitauei]
MNIRMEFELEEETLYEWIDYQSYNLQLIDDRCNKTIDIAHVDYDNMSVVFTIFLHVGESSQFVTSYKFISYDTQEDQIQEISDLHDTLYMYVHFTNDVYSVKIWIIKGSPLVKSNIFYHIPISKHSRE